jgi:hypothetical protein
VVLELGDVEDVLGGIRVGRDDRIRNDLLPDDGKERVLADIGDHHGGHLAVAFERMPKTGSCRLCRARVCLCECRQNSSHPRRRTFDRQAILQLPDDGLTEPMKEMAAVLRLTRGKSAAPVREKTPPIDPASFPSGDKHLSAFSDPRSATDPMGILDRDPNLA